MVHNTLMTRVFSLLSNISVSMENVCRTNPLLVFFYYIFYLYVLYVLSRSIRLPHGTVHGAAGDRTLLLRGRVVRVGRAADDDSGERLHHGTEEEPLQAVLCVEVPLRFLSTKSK